jgi:hypothetical protein
MKFIAKSILLLSILTLAISANAQTVCKGTLGDPVVAINFGSDVAQFGPERIGATNYTYVTTAPNEGEYTIANSTVGMYPSTTLGWHQTVNHTQMIMMDI